ncbi:MAG: extracellular solute-binding protein, partial [Anaerolineae bacterium]
MRKVSRRELLRLLGLGSAAAVVAACQPEVVVETVEKVVKETVIVEKEVEAEEISYSGELRVFVAKGAPVEPAHELLAASFTGRFPEAAVEFEYIVGDLAEQVYTRAAAGTLPDVLHTANLFVTPFAKNGVTVDLRPWTEADPDVDLEDVYPIMLTECTFDEEVHMLPPSLDVVAMYYNKTLLADAGAEMPTSDWTWDDFITQMKLVTEMEKDAQGTPQYWGLSNGTWSWIATVLPWVVGYGGSVLSEDASRSTWSSEESLAGLQAYADLWLEHNIAQPLGLDVGGDAFALGRAAVWTHIQGVRPYLSDAIGDKFDYDVEVVPLMPDGKHRTGMGAWGISVYSGSDVKEMAYEYAKGIITPSVQRLLAQKALTVPVLRSVAEDPGWAENLETPPYNHMAFVTGADDGVPCT